MSFVFLNLKWNLAAKKMKQDQTNNAAPREIDTLTQRNRTQECFSGMLEYLMNNFNKNDLFVKH